MQATLGYSLAITSSEPLASKAGLAVIARGGNGFDAAIAVSSVLGVIAPYHSGMGGGSFWLIRHAKKNIFIDAREVAPLRAFESMYLDRDGKVIKGASLNGPLAAAIPGHPAALAFISKKYAKLSLREDLGAAIKLAENGFEASVHYCYFINMGNRAQQLAKYPASRKIFLPYKKCTPGMLIVQKDLAQTLRLLAAKGRDGFYSGIVAEKLVRGVNDFGGIWSLADLKNYKVSVRKPLVGVYKDMTVISAPLPSAGGIALITMLNILDYYKLNTLPKTQQVHYIVEAMRMAYWQRGLYLGDKAPYKKLISMENAKELRRYIKPAKATPSSALKLSSAQLSQSPYTTHFSILDDLGNRLAVTQTINFIFGSSFVVPGTGVLLNDEMDDFSILPGKANVFGLIGSDPNKIAPAKKPLSSMAPTFLETPQRFAILGTPGGSRIPTMILLASLNFSNAKGAITMASSMRFHHQFIPDEIQIEPATLNQKQQLSLQKMGYRIKQLRQYFGDMQVITYNKLSNVLTAAADPRHSSAAISINNSSAGYGVDF